MSSTQQKLNWAIVGQGAIGLLAACRLQQAAYPVTLWLRQPNTLMVTLETTTTKTCYQFSPAQRPLRQVFVPVKAYALADCLKQLCTELSPDAQIVISHNGMPDLAYLQSVATLAQGIWFLSTSHAALRTASFVQHTGQGQSILCPLNNAARQAEHAIVEAMTEALGPVQLTEDIRPALWRKLAVNAVINPLTALHNCRNGELSNAVFTAQIAKLIAEVCQLAALEHIELEIQHTLAHVYNVIQATAQNYSSMQQDLYYRRPLEIEAITGFIIRTATKHQLSVPENQALWDALKQVTATQASKS